MYLGGGGRHEARLRLYLRAPSSSLDRLVARRVSRVSVCLSASPSCFLAKNDGFGFSTFDLTHFSQP